MKGQAVGTAETVAPIVVIQREGEDVEYRSVFSVLCVTCGAGAGQPCTSPTAHKTRVRLASYRPVTTNEDGSA